MDASIVTFGYATGLHREPVLWARRLQNQIVFRDGKLHSAARLTQYGPRFVPFGLLRRAPDCSYAKPAVAELASFRIAILNHDRAEIGVEIEREAALL